MSERELKIAHTEALFRDVNEWIAESAERFDSPDAAFSCPVTKIPRSSGS
jgi:hypothetical protein